MKVVSRSVRPAHVDLIARQVSGIDRTANKGQVLAFGRYLKGQLLAIKGRRTLKDVQAFDGS